MVQIGRNGHNIALVVDDDHQLVATVTDGDIRRAILEELDLEQSIQTLVDRRRPDQNRIPTTAPQGTPLTELAQLMRDHDVRHVPIIDGVGHIVDIVALTDLIQPYDAPMTAVVMAGGSGTRLRPYTNEVPKAMLPVGDQPLLELIIERLRQAGIRRVNLTTHYKKEIISEHFGDGRDRGVEIEYVEEDKPLGTAGALALLEPSEQPLLVINGDILTQLDFRAMLDFHQEHNAKMTVAVRQKDFQFPYGVIETDGILVTGISEKPTVRHFINAGIYLLNPEVCRLIPNDRPYDMPDLISSLIASGGRVISFPVEEYWLDIGQVENYKQAIYDVTKMEKEEPA
jgi:dTDP-glucose pyrophosphorylase